jgi:hypothetical protein
MWAGGPINGTFFKWANKWYTYPTWERHERYCCRKDLWLASNDAIWKTLTKNLARNGLS